MAFSSKELCIAAMGTVVANLPASAAKMKLQQLALKGLGLGGEAPRDNNPPTPPPPAGGAIFDLRHTIEGRKNLRHKINSMRNQAWEAELARRQIGRRTIARPSPRQRFRAATATTTGSAKVAP